MGEAALILCQRCSTRKDISEMRMDKSKNVLLCARCYYQVHARERKDRVMQSAEVRRIPYSCLSCGYLFTRNDSFTFGGICFNCGKKMVRREDTKELVVKPARTLLDY